MYGERKREMRNRALCYRKESKIISIYIYIYIYIYIEGNKKRERRGEEEAPPTETAGKSQRNNDSDGVSESVNKRQEKTLKVKCFMDSKKNHAKRIFLIVSHSCGHTSWR